MRLLLGVAAGWLAATIATAQDAPAPAAPAGPRRLAAAEMREAKGAIRAYFTAETAEARVAALARAEALPPLVPADCATLQQAVLAALKGVGTRYDGKGKGQIRLPEYPELVGEYLCQGSTGKRRVPLFVGLHGGGAGVGEGAQIAGLLGGGPGGCVCVFPTVMQKDDTAWNTEREEAYVLALIAELVRTFDIDTDRIYLAGHSMGGFGTWSIGSAHADRFAALSPGAGGIFAMRGAGGLQAPPGWLANLFATPVWFYHSTDDPRVGPAADQLADRELTRLHEADPAGYEFVYKEYTDRGHGIPPDGYGPIYDWMLARRRNPTPSTVVWQPRRRSKRQCFWLYWPAPALPGTMARGPVIRATLAAKNRIEVTGAPAGLEILLRPGFVDLKKPIALVVDGAERFTGLVHPSLGALLATAGESRDPSLVFTARLPVGTP